MTMHLMNITAKVGEHRTLYTTLQNQNMYILLFVYANTHALSHSFCLRILPASLSDVCKT